MILRRVFTKELPILINRAAWEKIGTNMEEAPKLLAGADLPSVSSLVAARRSLISEDRRENPGSSQIETPNVMARFPGSFKETSDSTRKHDYNMHVAAGQPNEDVRNSNKDPVLLGYGSKGNKIHYSGPLLAPAGKVDQILKDHDRHIQEAVRRARLDKAKLRRVQVEGNQLSNNSLFISGR